jgi:septal ring factor EnvC (AmiA/AmiB activator)
MINLFCKLFCPRLKFAVSYLDEESSRSTGSVKGVRFTLLLCFAFSLNVMADSEEAEHQAQLDKLKRTISSLEDKLQRQSQEKDSLFGQLKTIELKSTQLAGHIRQLRQQISAKESELSGLKITKGQLQGRIKEQSTAIAEQIRAAYKMGTGEPVKLLLNQQDPQQIARVFKYYDYLLQARSQKIQQFKADVDQLTDLEETINKTKIKLAKTRENLETESRALAQNRVQRTAKVQELESTLQLTEKKLDALKRQRSQLEEVIETLRSAAADFGRTDQYRSFASAKGQMLWPVKGKLLEKYGNRRTRDLRWEGWLIDVNLSSSVQAIHQGRVVFSNYLRGFGLLIIIDHSDGYMSLYAHNQELLRDTGVSVERGEIISRAGNTGGLSDPAVYFEIRKDGQPVNPKSWLQSARSL